MKELFNQRLKRHLQEMFKYLRLVFNDHFVFALLIMLGGLGLAYSNALKTLPNHVWWGAPVTIAVLLLALQIGGLATFLKDADVVFLLAKESTMPTYLRLAKRYSYLPSALIQAVSFFVLLPFIQVTIGLSLLQLAGLGLIQLVMKDFWLERETMTRFQQIPKLVNQNLWLRWVAPLVILVVVFYVQIWLGLVVSLLVDIAVRFWQHNLAGQPFSWWQSIGTENNRMLRIYRFFNLFTTVPMLKGKVKRRRYLDFLVTGIKKTAKNVYLYLYARGIIRSGEFSGLYFRLTILGMVLLFFVKGFWLPVVLAALFIYLIGFQLIPFYWQFDDIVFTHLYPVTEGQRVASFKRILGSLMTVTSVLLLIVMAIAQFNWQVLLITAIVETLEVFLMVAYYLPLRLRKKR